jgi:hypothetical protein
MRVINIHERRIPRPASAAGDLVDSLGSDNEALWPRSMWPALRLDRPLGVGATGGHGPIRYAVEDYVPGQRVRFRFLRPRGFNGHHCFEVFPDGDVACVLRHTIAMETAGMALLSWPLAIRPLHDALIEDALALAQASLAIAPEVRPWSARVKALRWLLSGGKARAQTFGLTSPRPRGR